ncbi:BON domain-containing protein [Tundrisphaera sp. TA3]|uniref:BON domain-containing protein n=1 Tax=Tundrisphaera sp. TA3 TaxID=3435775 RepID=UPI003EBC688C
MMWLVVIGLSFATAGEAFGQTVGERVGEGLDEAGRAVRRGFQTAGQAVRGGVNSAKTSVYNMEVVNRIYSRLHWDKALATSTLEAEVRAGGIVVLSGVVPDRAAKLKALTLTADTVGVVQVVDQVAIVTPGAPTAPAAIVPGSRPAVVESTPDPILESVPAETVVPTAPRR